MYYGKREILFLQTYWWWDCCILKHSLVWHLGHFFAFVSMSSKKKTVCHWRLLQMAQTDRINYYYAMFIVKLWVPKIIENIPVLKIRVTICLFLISHIRKLFWTNRSMLLSKSRFTRKKSIHFTFHWK